MCLFWKSRQRRLGIDDFGNPLPDAASDAHFQHHVPTPTGSVHVFVAEVVGAGVEAAGEDEQAAVAEAVQDALETTPLLPQPERDGSKTWLGGFFKRS